MLNRYTPQRSTAAFSPGLSVPAGNEAQASSCPAAPAAQGFPFQRALRLIMVGMPFAGACLVGCAERPPAKLRESAPALAFTSQKSATELVACVMAAQQQRHSQPTVTATPTGTSITDYDTGYLLSVTDIRDHGSGRDVSVYMENSPKLMMNRRRLRDVSSCE